MRINAAICLVAIAFVTYIRRAETTMRVLPTLVLLASVLTCLPALDVGQSAPPLIGVTWVKGEPLAAPSGVITVVEFWATWCAPCRETIPELSKMQKKYGDKVRFAGLSAEAPAVIKPFVVQMGTNMDYRVGSAPEALHDLYMAGVQGIPYSFLVDAKGMVLWQGHPGRLASPLAQVVAGTFDPVKAKALSDTEDALQKELQSQQPDVPAALAMCDRILAMDPVNGQGIAVRLAIAQFMKKPELVRSTLIAIPLAQLEGDLANSLARSRINDEHLEARNLDLALVFAERAVAADPDNAAYLDTKARALACLGFFDEAITIQQAAIKLAPDNVTFSASLAYYREVLALRAKRVPAATQAPVVVP